MNQDGTTKAEMLCTLFYISSAEMEKPKKEMKVPLILACAEEAGRLDARFKPSEAERDKFAGSIARLAADAPAHRRRLSKRAIVILVAAAILLITALTVYAVVTDLFDLFFNDPREMLEWENGESHRIGDNEMLVYTDVKEYSSISEVFEEEGLRFMFPHVGAEYSIEGISVTNHEPREPIKEVFVHYYNSLSVKVSFKAEICVDGSIDLSKESNFSSYKEITGSSGKKYYYFPKPISENDKMDQLSFILNGIYYSLSSHDVGVDVLIEFAESLSDISDEAFSDTAPVETLHETIDVFEMIPEHEDIPGTIIGAWSMDMNGHTTVYLFKSDGKGIIFADTGNEFEITYRIIDDHQIEVSMTNVYGESVTDTSDYELADDALILDGITCTRVS